jgi:DNA-binding response OmpR family regulator
MRVTKRLPDGSETILVVEDEASLLNSIKRILVRHGYTVLEARHGADALQVIAETERAIDLVMTDLMMPGMSGRELIPELQALSSRPPRVLVMSGERAVLRRDSLPPGTGFLNKPFTMEELLQTVRAVLDAKLVPPT